MRDSTYEHNMIELILDYEDKLKEKNNVGWKSSQITTE